MAITSGTTANGRKVDPTSQGLTKEEKKVIFAEILAIRQGSQQDAGLIYFGRDYHPVGTEG